MQEELIKQFQNGNKRAGDDFYNANIGLVYLAAKKYKPETMDYEEALAIVNQAFANVMEKFDPTKAEFTTYFMVSARGHILRHCRDFAHTIRVKRLDFAANKITIVCDSLDRVVHRSKGADILLKDVRGKEDDYTQIMVDEALEKLNKKDGEAFKLQLRYGLSQREIGKLCDCNQVEVSRRVARAKASLKKFLKEVS